MLDPVQITRRITAIEKRLEFMRIEVPTVGGGGGAIGGTIGAGQVAYGTALDTIGGEAGFEYDDGTNTLTVTNLVVSGIAGPVFAYPDAASQFTALANAVGYLYNDGAGGFSYQAAPLLLLHNMLSATHTDTTPAAVVRGDLITGQGVAPTWSRLAISAPAATFMNYLGASNGDTEPGYKALFDITVPTTVAPGDVAATGTATIAARRDHTHGAPATYPATAHNLLSATHGDTVVNGATRGSLIYGNVTPAWDELVLGGISGSVLTRNATDVIWSAGGLSFGGAYTLTIPATGTALLRTNNVAAGRVLFGSDANTADAEDALFWDAANNRLGLNASASPGYTLHAVGAASEQFIGLFAESGITPENSVAAPASGRMVSVQGNGAAYFMGRDVTNNIEFIMGTTVAGASFAGSMTNHNFQLRTNNTTWFTLNTSGNVGIGYFLLPSARLHVAQETATTNAILEVARLEAQVTSTGVAAAGFGPACTFYGESSVDTTYRKMAQIAAVWATATDATRKARGVWSIWDTAEREGMRIEASGTAPMLSFYGGTAVIRGGALTAALDTIKYTAPGTPDYDIQDLASGGYGFVTSDEGQTVLSVIANLQQRVNEIEARLNGTTGVNLFA